jgi:hypothetical protein
VRYAGDRTRYDPAPKTGMKSCEVEVRIYMDDR